MTGTGGVCADCLLCHFHVQMLFHRRCFLTSFKLLFVTVSLQVMELDKGRLMDVLMKDIGDDKEWARVRHIDILCDVYPSLCIIEILCKVIRLSRPKCSSYWRDASIHETFCASPELPVCLRYVYKYMY